MTAFDQFDLVDTRIAGAIEDLAAASRPDYIDDVLQVTAANRQRPRWTFPERLLPVDTTLGRPMALRRTPLRALAVALLLLILIAAATAIYVGSQPRVPPPFGPADNGEIIYSANGDLYVRNTLDASGHLLIGGDGLQYSPAWSPDGRWFTFATTKADGDHFMVARADGTGVREIALIPLTGNAQAAWRPDSGAVALIYDVKGVPVLRMEFVDGSPTQEIDLGDLVPLEVGWRPPDGAELLLRVKHPNDSVDLVVTRPDGKVLHEFGLPSDLIFGPDRDNVGSTWSPDGTRIAYARVIQNPTAQITGTFRVHVINADGTGDVALPAPIDLGIQEAWPAFSPDGTSILVHRWTWNTETQKGDGWLAKHQGEGWLAVMPSDGSAPARDIGPKLTGGEETGLIKTWSPDGTRVLMRSDNRRAVYSINPVSGAYESIPWTTDLPDWQRTVH